MKFLSRIMVLSLLIAGQQTAMAQSPLKVTTHKLSNGLTVFLNEDHTSSKVFGAVVVKAGGVNDPKDATGIAHYFEHMMFKGTDKIGTTNWEKEKVYLDSISSCYDQLGATTDEAKRYEIQRHINKLSLAASDYAIPNEVDKLLKKIGGKGINAYTSFEQTVYHNSFPANQLDKWLDIYAERFRNPVFRLFQSELETVYEEKNMSMDNPLGKFMETLMQKSFPGHPMGEQTILGKIEHLKNPSLNKMRKFYETYYVANNMALVLSGDFDTKEALAFIEQKFSGWPNRELPAKPTYAIAPFVGRELVSVKETPVKVGLLGFRTVSQNNPDQLALELCNDLLSNRASTGLLDKLRMDNKVMMAMAQNMSVSDVGIQQFIIVPKLVGQSLETAEGLVLAEVNKLKSGDFDEALIESAKTNHVKNFDQSLEEVDSRGNYIVNAFVTGKTWEEYLQENEDFGKLTKEDVMRVANKYFGDNYLALFSKMGFPKKEKLAKPPYDAVVPKNTEAKSDFAQMLDSKPETIATPRFIEFGKDVQLADLSSNNHFYYTENPINKVFNLTLKYGVGSYKYPVLNQAAQYMDLIGTETKDFQTYKNELQKLGASVSFSTTNGYLSVDIDGFDDKLPQTLALVNELLTKPKADPKQMEKFIEEAKMNFKMESKDPSTLAEALREYGMYGDNSSYLKRLSLKEIKKLTGDSLISAFKVAQRYEAEIHYSGTVPFEQIQETIKKNIALAVNPIKSESPVSLVLKPYAENTILLLNDKKAIQSKVYIIRDGKVNNDQERIMAAAFNNYFGGDMSSLVFQEIREFRSLAYTAYANYRNPFYKGEKSYLTGFVSTQSDKTIDAMNAMFTLLDTMPSRVERLPEIKASLVQSINTGNPSFRDKSTNVENWRKQGYSDDPRKVSLEVFKNLQFSDIENFYINNVKGRPSLITINGDGKRIDMKKLQRFGKIVEVKKNQIIRE
ncbi:M16 family metallopeptidase [Williamwhitmania taraxaci]|uniref:Predicted Zn-dependent peptidase n=1 Tax=Williamwhitmania taraxaci TaxID=1640674 RepID=A0A1G6H3G4_9BACT|nr:M16 family metallopeptidase [Williamwhitmania taraxaci]SDB88850.1 Predicted Zn-dependent peptidase [Williamwhitmania taraxaci]